MSREADGGRQRISPKSIIAIVLVVVVLVLAIANAQKVTLDFVVADVRLPLFLVIVGSALVGWVVGWFMGRNRD